MGWSGRIAYGIGIRIDEVPVLCAAGKKLGDKRLRVRQGGARGGHKRGAATRNEADQKVAR